MKPIHGMSYTPEYEAWKGAKRRCGNPRYRQYRLYGGRGIRVCAEWRASFQAFYADMGPRPSDAHSLDRINPDGNYEPANCRWALITQQNRNFSARNSSLGVNGVRFVRGRYYAYIHAQSQQISLGGHSDFLSACCARKSAELKYWSDTIQEAA